MAIDESARYSEIVWTWKGDVASTESSATVCLLFCFFDGEVRAGEGLGRTTSTFSAFFLFFDFFSSLDFDIVDWPEW